VYAPALSQFEFGGQSVGTPSVRTSITGDVYLSLIALPEGGAEGGAADGEIVLRVIIEPLVAWLWIGGGIIALGTMLAAFPGHRRQGTDPASAPVPERIGTLSGDATSSRRPSRSGGTEGSTGSDGAGGSGTEPGADDGSRTDREPVTTGSDGGTS